MMNWFAFLPGMYKDEKVGGDKIGFFVNPAREGRGLDARRPGHLGRRLLTDNMDGALAYIKWFAQPDVQKKWWALGGYSCLKARAERSLLHRLAALRRATSSTPWASVQDFWQEPSYASLLQAMQKRLHDYVVADKGTAKEALDQLINDWTEVFKEEGKI